MILRILPFLLLPLLGLAQTNSKVEKPMGENTTSEKQPLEIKRNAQYNLEEIKVRWKKAALENCTGVPCVAAPSFTCGTSTVSDVDGNSYNTVSIGTQCWTKQNLKVTNYNDGVTPIPDQTSISPNTDWGNLQTGARTDNPGVSGYVGTFGYLYNGYAAAGIITNGGSPTKNICPTGWHVPTLSDWNKLVKFIDPVNADTSYVINSTQISGTASGRLKSKVTNPNSGSGLGWNPATQPNPGTDDYGFSALPSGSRYLGSFYSVGDNTTFFCSTTVTDPNFGGVYVWGFNLSYDDNRLFRFITIPSNGQSVRCLKD
jgi:uncharacterized protein (TIGR02145 family)